MRPIYHVAGSAAAGLAVGIYLESTASGAACLLSGIFIDLDHFIDYYAARGKMTWNYRELFDYCARDPKGKLYLFFHSFEAIAISWLAVYFYGMSEVFIGFIAGLTVHMICDQIGNPLKPFSYFLLYRIKHGFERKHLFNKEYFEKYILPQ